MSLRIVFSLFFLPFFNPSPLLLPPPIVLYAVACCYSHGMKQKQGKKRKLNFKFVDKLLFDEQQMGYFCILHLTNDKKPFSNDPPIWGLSVPLTCSLCDYTTHTHTHLLLFAFYPFEFRTKMFQFQTNWKIQSNWWQPHDRRHTTSSGAFS